MPTKAELECIIETMKHIDRVREMLNRVAAILVKRGEQHDSTKLEEPELSLFAKYTPLLASLEFGSDEYKESLENLKPALEHHYAKERHHPEHFKNGVDDMNLIDLVEMFIDWRASSERQNNGNLLQSIERAAERFGFSEQLTSIFRNTIHMFEQE